MHGMILLSNCYPNSRMDLEAKAREAKSAGPRFAAPRPTVLARARKALQRAAVCHCMQSMHRLVNWVLREGLIRVNRFTAVNRLLKEGLIRASYPLAVML